MSSATDQFPNTLVVTFTQSGLSARGVDRWVPLADTADFINRLQRVFSTVASSDFPILIPLGALSKRQRGELMRLQVTGVSKDALHLLIRPNIEYAATLHHPGVTQELESVFLQISNGLVGAAKESPENRQQNALMSIRKGLRELAKAIKPNGMKIGISIGLPAAANLYAELNYDWAQQTLALEEPSELSHVTVRELPIDQPTLTDALEGPYNGSVLETHWDDSVFMLQCDDYTEPIPCQYDSTQYNIVSQLKPDDGISIWGKPIRESGSRTDKSPRMLTRIQVRRLIDTRN